MTVAALAALGATSTGTVASLLATLLAASPAPATLVLEELARTQIRIEVLGRADRELTAAEHCRLDAGPITAGHHRTGLLRTASGMVAAETSLVILPRAESPHARRPGRHERPGGQDPGPLGVQRLDRRALCRHGCWDTAGGDVAVQSSPRCSPSTAPRWPLSQPSGSPGTCAASSPPSFPDMTSGPASHRVGGRGSYPCGC